MSVQVMIPRGGCEGRRFCAPPPPAARRAPMPPPPPAAAAGDAAAAARPAASPAAAAARPAARLASHALLAAVSPTNPANDFGASVAGSPAATAAAGAGGVGGGGDGFSLSLRCDKAVTSKCSYLCATPTCVAPAEYRLFTRQSDGLANHCPPPAVPTMDTALAYMSACLSQSHRRGWAVEMRNLQLAAPVLSFFPGDSTGPLRAEDDFSFEVSCFMPPRLRKRDFDNTKKDDPLARTLLLYVQPPGLRVAEPERALLVRWAHTYRALWVMHGAGLGEKLPVRFFPVLRVLREFGGRPLVRGALDLLTELNANVPSAKVCLRALAQIRRWDKYYASDCVRELIVNMLYIAWRTLFAPAGTPPTMPVNSPIEKVQAKLPPAWQTPGKTADPAKLANSAMLAKPGKAAALPAGKPGKAAASAAAAKSSRKAGKSSKPGAASGASNAAPGAWNAAGASQETASAGAGKKHRKSKKERQAEKCAGASVVVKGHSNATYCTSTYKPKPENWPWYSLGYNHWFDT